MLEFLVETSSRRWEAQFLFFICDLIRHICFHLGLLLTTQKIKKKQDVSLSEKCENAHFC